MSQPVDRVYVEILPDVKGFDKKLARTLKTKIEKSFGGTSTGGGGGGSVDLTEKIFGSTKSFQPHIQQIKSYRKIIEDLQKGVDKSTAGIEKASEDTSKVIDRMALRNENTLRRMAEVTDNNFGRVAKSTESKFDNLGEKNADKIAAMMRKIQDETRKFLDKESEDATKRLAKQLKDEEALREKELQDNLRFMNTLKNREIADHAYSVSMKQKMYQDMEKLRVIELKNEEIFLEKKTQAQIRQERIVKQTQGARGFLRGLGGKVDKTPGVSAQDVGSLVSMPIRGGAAALNTFSTTWSNLEDAAQATRLAAIATTAVLTGPLVVALAGSLPLAAGVAGASLGTLALGFMGVGDALKVAGDPEKFAKELAKLPPAARTFTLELASLIPMVKEIRAEAARGLFEGFEGELTSVANNLKGPVKEGVFEVGQAWQFLGKGVTDYLSSAKGAEVTNHIFETTATILRGWRPALDSTLEALGNLTIKATPFVEKLNEKIAGGVDKFADKLNQWAADGTMDAFFDNAVKDLEAMVTMLGHAKDLAKAVADALPENGLQRLAENITQFRSRSAIDSEDDEKKKSALLSEEVARRFAREGLGGDFKELSIGQRALTPFGAEEDRIREIARNKAEAINSLKDSNLMSQDSEFNAMIAGSTFGDMKSAGEETNKLWDSLIQVNTERATELYTALADKNKAAAEDYKQKFMEKTGITEEQWNLILGITQTKTVEVNATEAAALDARAAQERAAIEASKFTWSGLWDDLAEGAKNGWDTITQTGIVGSVGFIVSFQQARDQGQGIFSSLWAGIVGGAQAAWNNVKRIWSSNPVAAYGANPPTYSTGPQARAANGAVVTGPTAMLTGEAGDEMVFPLTGNPGRKAMDLLAQSFASLQSNNSDVGPGGAAGQTGVRMWPSTPMAQQTPAQLVVQSGGTALDDLIVEVISKVVRNRNGDPVQVFSAGKFMGVPA